MSISARLSRNGSRSILPVMGWIWCDLPTGLNFFWAPQKIKITPQENNMATTKPPAEPKTSYWMCPRCKREPGSCQCAKCRRFFCDSCWEEFGSCPGCAPGPHHWDEDNAVPPEHRISGPMIDKGGPYEQGLRDAVHKNVMLKDLILAAFVAEVGCLPSECCLVQHNEKGGERIVWTIEKAADIIPNRG